MFKTSEKPYYTPKIQFYFYRTKCVHVTFFTLKTYIKKLRALPSIRFSRYNSNRFKKLSYNISINKYREISNVNRSLLRKYDIT